MMDYNKLIEAIRLCGSAPKVYQCKKCAYWSGGNMGKCIPKMTEEAATALYALQVGNAQMERQLSEFSKFLSHMTGNMLSKTTYTAKAMIASAEDYQQNICDEDCDVRAALEDMAKRNDDLLAELEKVKAERDAAVESIPHDCKTCAYHVVFFNGCTPDHDCTNPDGGCSNNYDRWQWRGIKED